MKAKRNKHAKKDSSIIKKILFILFISIFIVLTCYLIYHFYSKNKDKTVIEEIQESKIIENTENKVQELKSVNADVIGWIKIDDTKIDYPILQTIDNEFYLTHDYKKEDNKYGSIYLKSGCNINNVNSNLIVYGHNMKDDEMFNSLLKYQDKSFFDEHKIVNIETENEKRKYEIIAVFKSRVFYKDEKNVFRYYDYLNFESEDDYNEYINNVKQIQLYDTGNTASYGEQLLTMITCEYTQENGRMIVVAKRIE